MNYELLPEQITIRGFVNTGIIILNNRILKPSESQLMYNHSPSGFSWGYIGSGPAQLALAILLRFLVVDDAMRLHQAFKYEVIAKLPLGVDFDCIINFKQTIKYLEGNV